MSTETIRVPDIGGATDVEVIEISVKVGDIIEVDQPIVVLETDKASMDVPSPIAGKVSRITINEGDQVNEGDVILDVEVVSSSTEVPAAVESAPAPVVETPVATAPTELAELAVAVPDIGGAEGVEVIEVCVAVGDDVAEGDSIIVLETDKASMDIPAPATGKVTSIAVSVGDTVSETDAILVLELQVSGSSAPAPQAAAPETPSTVQVADVVTAPVAGGIEKVHVPDIGGATGVDVIEVAVNVGDKVAEGDAIIVLETDKASMEIPAPKSGVVKSLSIKEGDQVSEGDFVLELEVEGSVAVSAPVAAPQAAASSVSAPVATKTAPTASSADPSAVLSTPSKKVHAGPAVRLLARELGVDLSLVRATGPRGRILKEDLHAYVKAAVKQAASGSSNSATAGAGLPTVPDVDFSQFGDVEIVKLST